MKRNGLYLLLFALASLASSSLLCAEDEEVTPNILRSRDGRVQIELPRSYSEKPPAKPAIHILASDDARANTVVVISENQSQFENLEKYADIVRGKMCQNLREAQCDSGVKIIVAGHPAMRFEITGIGSNGLRMGFLLTIIQTETRFNQVIGSCLRPHFSDRKEEFAKIAAMLKELPPPKKVAEK